MKRIRYHTEGNTCFHVKEVVNEDKRAYYLRLAGCYGVKRVRKNGKDGKVWSRERPPHYY